MQERPAEIVACDVLRDLERNAAPSPECAQAALEAIVASHPHWAEPACRLALLHYVRRDYAGAQRMADAALESKPWHFEALHLQLLLCLAHRRDSVAALRWARKGLPPLSTISGGSSSLQPSRRRQRWVQWAVQTASLQLAQLERESEESESSLLWTTTTTTGSAAPTQQATSAAAAAAWQ
jgi:hypothetical protein